MMRKPKVRVEEKFVKVTKNEFNQAQLDAFADLLHDLYMSVSDKEYVARTFCEHFGVKQKERFMEHVNPDQQPMWEQVN